MTIQMWGKIFSFFQYVIEEKIPRNERRSVFLRKNSTAAYLDDNKSNNINI